jgi:hypothetical protein
VNGATQDALGPDQAVVQEARLLLGQDQYHACPIGESLEDSPRSIYTGLFWSVVATGAVPSPTGASTRFSKA